METTAAVKHTNFHFVLVHGICHGAWCWFKLVPLLKAAGHRVTALDLASCGVHPKRIQDVHSISDYLQPLMDFMASLPVLERVFLVGHSYGGLSISLAMERFPQKVCVGVFVTSYMPNFKHPPAVQMQEFFKRNSIASLMDTRFSFDKGQENPPTSALLGPDYIATKVYQYCQLEDIELAKMLVRPDGIFVEDMSKDSLLTEEKYGSVNRVYVVCEEDEVMDERFQRFVIENSPPHEVKSIPRAGHMVMLSKPQNLCFSLLDIAKKYA